MSRPKVFGVVLLIVIAFGLVIVNEAHHVRPPKKVSDGRPGNCSYTTIIDLLRPGRCSVARSSSA